MFIKRVVTSCLLLVLLLFLVLVCERKLHLSPTAPPINYHDKNLQEIITESEYIPKDKRNIPHEDDEESTINLDEEFRYIGGRAYCYNKKTNIRSYFK